MCKTLVVYFKLYYSVDSGTQQDTQILSHALNILL